MSSFKKRFKAVSIFTGAGGLDIGFERAGFEIVSALEKNPSFYQTIITNQNNNVKIKNTERYYFEGTHVVNADISDISAKDLSDVEVDILIGGPPCQSFSSAGKQKSIFDERGTLIYEYYRILKELNPKTFLFENVRGLVTAKGKKGEPGEILNELLELFNGLGYSCRVSLMNAAEYGGYQRRVRCFIIGSRIAAAPEFPYPQYAKEEEPNIIPEFSKKKWKTLGDFLEIYADNDETQWVRPTESLAKELSCIESGKGLRSKGRVEATRPGGHWGYRQGTFIADLSLPARTVTGSSSQDWIRLQDGSLRRITMREAAGLQGFPPEWIFEGKKADQYQQIGNAVPVVFGELLGEIFYSYLDGGYMNSPEHNETVLPSDIKENIRYTKYDNEKNGAYRAGRK